MLRKFAICDPALGEKQVATLLYNEADKSFGIEILKNADVAKLPISLKIHAEQDRYLLNESFSIDWVRSRICPPSRQNISTILHEIGLDEYDEFGLISYTKGRCMMDDLYLKEQAL